MRLHDETLSRGRLITRAAALGAGVVMNPLLASAQTAQTLRVVGLPIDGWKSAYYAVKSGLFKKYGLDVQTQIMASGAAAAAALAGGAADVVYTNTLTAVQAFARKVPMQFVATGNFAVPGKSPTLTLVLKDSPIKSGRDMNGKTLGSAALKDINAGATFAWIDKTGGDSSTVKVIEVPPAAGAAFLEQHRADAVTLNEPLASQALATGNVRVLAQPYDAFIGNMLAGYVALEPVIKEKSDAMARFAKAMHEASTWTNAHQAETIPMVAEFTGIEPDVIAKGARFTDADYVEARYLQPLVDLFAKYRFIDAAFPAQDIISAVCVKPPR